MKSKHEAFTEQTAISARPNQPHTERLNTLGRKCRAHVRSNGGMTCVRIAALGFVALIYNFADLIHYFYSNFYSYSYYYTVIAIITLAHNSIAIYT